MLWQVVPFTTVEFEMPELEQKKMAPGFVIEADFPKLGRPQMSFKSAENWNVDELDEKRLFGSKVHLILSGIKTAADLKIELDRCLHKGLIEDSDVDLIQSEIEKLFQDSKFAGLFFC
jgi:hypothetical protein